MNVLRDQRCLAGSTSVIYQYSPQLEPTGVAIAVIIIPLISKNVPRDATRMKNTGYDALIVSCKPSPVQDTGFQFGRKSDILAERMININTIQSYKIRYNSPRSQD